MELGQFTAEDNLAHPSNKTWRKEGELFWTGIVSIFLEHLAQYGPDLRPAFGHYYHANK